MAFEHDGASSIGSSGDAHLEPSAAPEPQRRPFDAVVTEVIAHAAHVVAWLRVPAQERDDLVQDSVLEVFGSYHRYDPRRPLKPWVAQIAYHVVNDHRKRARNRRELLSTSDAPPGDEAAGRCEDAPPSAEERISTAEERAILDALLGHLDPERREVLGLLVFGELTLAETAERLGICEGTASTRYRLAKQDLETAWRRRAAVASTCAGPSP
jgi:RNA polymerase sigma-70 factor (ECF subfamily)